MRCTIDIAKATTRPGSTLRLSRRQLGWERPSKTARGVARSALNSNLSQVISWPSSIGVPAALPTRIWILQLKKHGIHKLIVIGLIATTCVEAAVRFAAELGFEVTVVRDATADLSDDKMHAAIDINIPNYATAIVTTDEIVSWISVPTASNRLAS